MAIVSTLPRNLGLTGRKLAVVQAAITGTGSMATGLAGLITGGAVVSVANAATTVTTQVASVTSVTGGSVAVVVVDLQAAANAISAAPKNVNLWAIGS